jgi:hypothetical protein
MSLLSSVSLGRIVFTARALPAIRPVTHLVDGDYVIIRTDRNAAITSELRARAGTVVAYEADAIGRDRDPGMTGRGRGVGDLRGRYEDLRPCDHQTPRGSVTLS